MKLFPRAVDGIMQNSLERLYCFFLWKATGNYHGVT